MKQGGLGAQLFLSPVISKPGFGCEYVPVIFTGISASLGFFLRISSNGLSGDRCLTLGHSARESAKQQSVGVSKFLPLGF